MLKKYKKSIYFRLAIIIFLTVVAIISLHSTFDYFQIKQKIIKNIENNAQSTISSLKENISTLISAYAVNEYETLIYNEIKQKDISAIIIEDYNMGKILGQKSYITGKIKNENSLISNYKSSDEKDYELLKNYFYSHSSYIKDSMGNNIGLISIYISDNKINEELEKIIKESIVNTLALAVFLILALLVAIKLILFRPISQIIDTIANSNEDGIPVNLLIDNKYIEISTLTKSINKMILSVKTSQETLKKSENRLKNILEMSPIAVRIAKDNGENVVFSNSTYLKLINQDNSDISKVNLKNYYDDKNFYSNILEKLKNNNAIFNKLVKLNIDNKIIWALASYMNIEFDGEKAILGWFYDITQNKKTEFELYQALDLQTAIFDNSGYVMIRTDKDGLIKQINKEASRLLGYAPEELIDIHTPKLFHLESEMKQRAKEFSNDLNIDVEPSFELFVIKTKLHKYNEYQWTYVAKNGKHIPVMLSVTALKDKDDVIYGYIGIARDITEHKILESQTRLASMGEMIGNIAHQWRQPLAVISSISSGIRVRSEFSELNIDDIISEMNTITEQTKYLSKTIDDFRNFIKDSNNKEEISIVSTIEKAISILKSTLVNNQITLITNLNEDITILGYENQLIQAIINIVNNAKDAINENKKEDNFLFIETKRVNDTLILSITDSGGGIPKNILPRIFEPYFTTKHQSIGTGIGLSMVHKIITQQHNAKINVYVKTYQYENIECVGASFEIIFKLK